MTNPLTITDDGGTASQRAGVRKGPFLRPRAGCRGPIAVFHAESHSRDEIRCVLRQRSEGVKDGGKWKKCSDSLPPVADSFGPCLRPLYCLVRVRRLRPMGRLTGLRNQDLLVMLRQPMQPAFHRLSFPALLERVAGEGSGGFLILQRGLSSDISCSQRQEHEAGWVVSGDVRNAKSGANSPTTDFPNHLKSSEDKGPRVKPSSDSKQSAAKRRMLSFHCPPRLHP